MNKVGEINRPINAIKRLCCRGKLNISNSLKNNFQILILYRYISWFFTSSFYLLSSTGSTLPFKIGASFAVLIAGRIAVHLYNQCSGVKSQVLGLVTIETLGIAILLIPTGGLDSPFMWYALNPIFITAYFLPGFYCWGVLAIFLTVATAGSCSGSTYSFFSIWQEKYWFLLVFVLLTTASQLFMRLIKELSAAYDKASEAQQKAEHSLEHITALYQALESFSSGENPGHLAGLLSDYGKKLTKSPAAVCFLNLDNSPFLWEKSDPYNLLGDKLTGEFTGIMQQLSREPVCRLPVKCENRKYRELVCLPISSSGNRFGFLGYLDSNKQPFGQDSKQVALFLCELGAVVLERLRTEEMSSRLMVVEEQNRIANEIHDGAAQHLFSIVSGLHALSQKKGSLQDEEVNCQINLLKKNTNQAARELRAAIYRISPLKRGEQAFITGLKNYFEGMEQLNDIKIYFNHEGNEEAISPALRKALYRIVCEASSNAARHGKCSNINIFLQMSPGKIMLEIVDDGEGFDIQNVKTGLGLANMQNLMLSFNGGLVFNSKPGEGTKIICAVPGDNLIRENTKAGGALIESVGGR